MNKTDLVNKLADRLGGNKKVASDAVEGVIDLVQREVQRGGNVSISGFGVFEKRARAARTARNPRTGDAVKVRRTNVPAFRPGKYFKDVISGAVKLPRVSAATTSRAAVAAAKPTPARKAATKAAPKAPARAAAKAPARKAATKAAPKAPARAAAKAPARKAAPKAPARAAAKAPARKAAPKAPARAAAKAPARAAAKAPARKAASKAAPKATRPAARKAAPKRSAGSK